MFFSSIVQGCRKTARFATAPLSIQPTGGVKGFEGDRAKRGRICPSVYCKAKRFMI